MPAIVTIRAHAKVNLDLRVLGTRADGFHELRTVFQALALHDVIRCIPRPGPFAIECAAAGIPLDETNLIWRAAQTLWRSLRRAGAVRDVVVQLEKQIPQQAGLGGGSADAAATLMALAGLWRVRVIYWGAWVRNESGDYQDAIAQLASWCAQGKLSCHIQEVYPLADLPRHWIVLLIPGFGVSTSEAYGWYDAERELSRAPREAQHVPGPWPSRAAQMINDLEAPIAAHHPEIDQMKAALKRAGALAAAMSGSGSTVFGLFQKGRDALNAMHHLKGSGWQAILTETLDRGEYARVAAARKSRLN